MGSALKLCGTPAWVGKPHTWNASWLDVQQVHASDHHVPNKWSNVATKQRRDEARKGGREREDRQADETEAAGSGRQVGNEDACPLLVIVLVVTHAPEECDCHGGVAWNEESSPYPSALHPTIGVCGVSSHVQTQKPPIVSHCRDGARRENLKMRDGNVGLALVGGGARGGQKIPPKLGKWDGVWERAQLTETITFMGAEGTRRNILLTLARDACMSITWCWHDGM